MSRRNVAIGGLVVVFSVITGCLIFAATYSALQSVNPAAALAAVTVALIGFAWFKKSNN
jgi:uncharacterized membrane protein